ncbi:LacI family transcriptional regulator [Bacillus thuringiensis serovar silo]|uniref:LacI family transcriptional regulator n=1 Tax=Bacillus thuringiensis TaxID=1428 RepID=UPI000A3B21D3|nr:LacI family transcriptional regulator [Bacillus thuringiensis]MED3275460.1 LacI family transcriptional regulator [Bacillus thuringiensis]OTW62418.1 LacI family transcriptional regulator [Bacillus thuringiensis serovar toguchini]OTW63061.1 LacI family transcriptional regulator [Bacillus thuringiensis serovar silo]
MSQFIHTLKQVIVLYDSSKKPYKSGDIVKLKGKSLLIIGIEAFKISGIELTIWYTMQDLEFHDFISISPKPMLSQLEHLSVLYRYNDERFENLQPGRTVPHRGKRYKVIEHIRIAVNNEMITLQFSATQVLPMERGVIRTKYFDEKKKQLEINVF